MWLFLTESHDKFGLFVCAGSENALAHTPRHYLCGEALHLFALRA